METEECATCYYAGGKVTFDIALVQCKCYRYPKSRNKYLGDWCGEWRKRGVKK